MISRAAKLMQASGLWIIAKKGDDKLEIRERRILPKDFGGVKMENGGWKHRTNAEMQRIFGKPLKA